MKARGKALISLAVAFGGFATSLSGGCRDFSSNPVSIGAEGGAPVMTEGGVAGETADGGGRDTVAGGGGEGGAAFVQGGAAGAAPLTEVSVAVAAPIDLDGTWSELMAFADAGKPHFIAHWGDTKATEFRGFDEQRSTTNKIWGNGWDSEMTFMRLPADRQERFATYVPATGKRMLATFEPKLAGLALLDGTEEAIELGYTHHASDVVPGPFFYWYNANTGELRGELLNADATQFNGTFNRTLHKGFHQLVAINGHLLGFHEQSADSYDLREVVAETAPKLLADLGATERVVAFVLDGRHFLFCYSLVGKARVLELMWDENDEPSAREAWSGDAVSDGRSVSGVGLPGEFLILVHDGVKNLQLVSIKL